MYNDPMRQIMECLHGGYRYQIFESDETTIRFTLEYSIQDLKYLLNAYNGRSWDILRAIEKEIADKPDVEEKKRRNKEGKENRKQKEINK